ncbi:MAG: alpha/beta fold hydrolase [Thermoanaerobaculia bacterium]|nr:alpha/beta fold hydrolase [Thermoanaerobaculia bacterium]
MSSDPNGPQADPSRLVFPGYFAVIRAGFSVLERLAPGLVGPAAVRIFRTARRFPTPDRELAWLASAEPLTLAAGGRRIAGHSWGRGPTVLLLHGWEGRGSQMGAFARPLADAGYRVVALDAPGHGGSEGRLSSLPEFAAAVIAADDELGPLHAIVAHSFGAAGTGWALLSGVEAERLVFLAAPDDLHRYIGFYSSLLGLSARGRHAMLATLEKRAGVDWSRARYATAAAADATPILVVHDEDDPECPFAGGRKIAEAWPRAEMTSTTGLGHNRILRDPAVVARVVGFVAASESAPRIARAG